MGKVLAWHFLSDDGYTRFEPRVKVAAGDTITVDGKLELCRWGCHASRKISDALDYAPGALVCRVELSGKILDGEDKLCAQHRKVLWMVDATRTLHEFAVECATRAMQLTGWDDWRSWAALDAKLGYLEGMVSTEDLAAAKAAAGDAAGDAERKAQQARLVEKLEALNGPRQH